MGDRPHDRDGDAVSDAHWMVQKLMKEPTLIDEAYSQLCKQLTNNPTQESVKRGWGLFSVLAASIRPTKSLYPSLLNFVESHASAEKAPVIIVNAASYTRAKLTRVFQIGPRRSVPSLQEINLVLVSMSLRVTLLSPSVPIALTNWFANASSICTVITSAALRSAPQYLESVLSRSC
ncbi:hypothetical protein EV182_008280 [Spiromyces aspiralis]|uniref:Uncharacterized protein n=1 Tax=Spiromyces aspiralis TaxID=68401 RepID=A0ACC1HM89_9FUNG|nr:hypothetical protein EV182_008280 [Spiromyces aspiralis]